MSSTGDTKKVAAFLGGLASSQLFMLLVSSGGYSVERFMIPKSFVGLYINRTLVAYRISSFIGTLLANILVLFWQDFKKNLNIISSVTTSLYCVAFSVLLIVYYYGGEKGHIMYYYLAIIFASFIYGLDNILLSNVAVGELVWYGGSVQLAAITVSVYQSLFVKVARQKMLTRVGYKLIVGQLIMAVFLTAVSAISWVWAYGIQGGGGTSGSSNGSDDWTQALPRAISPILMTTFGFGMQSFFYPAIAPYKFVGMARGSRITRTILFTSTIPSITIMFLSSKEAGPNKPWSNTGWHAVWLFYIIEFCLGLICISSLHYPSASSFFMMDRMLVISALTICYDCCVQITRAVGMNGAPWQDGPGQKNPTMASVNTCMYTFTMIIFAFMGDGYLSTYRMYEMDPDNWPTKHYGRLRAFWFWTWNATIVAWRNLGASYTSDIRASILGKKDYLFIVYTDG